MNHLLNEMFTKGLFEATSVLLPALIQTSHTLSYF